MIIGDFNDLTVLRVSDIAYILSDGEQEIFMHKKESDKEYKEGDSVKAFVYTDSKRRICATSNATPLISVKKPAFLKVVSVREKLGFFLATGLPKDLLLAESDCFFKDQPELFPQPGDYLYVFLKTTNDNFRAKLLPKNAIRDYLVPQGKLHDGDTVKAYINQIKEDGMVAFTLDGFEIFIPNNLSRNYHRIGEELNVQIVKMVDYQSYRGSIIKKKEIQMDFDAKKVYEYLKKVKVMTITDNSEPIEIYQAFQMSKAAFKRAIGRLFKEKLIEISDSQIKLKVE